MYSSNAISDVFNNIDERHTCGSYHHAISVVIVRIVVVFVNKYIVLNVVTFIIAADKSRL